MREIIKKRFYLLLLVGATSFVSCSDSEDELGDMDGDDIVEQSYPAIEMAFDGKINLNALDNYADQAIPSYITKDNTAGNSITDRTATLGRVLFYDKNLSSNGTVSCASCHQQASGFGDQNQLSTGVNGVTGRHSMRLVNARFGDEDNFFWDERAATLEEQTTMPIQDHAEMGFSGENGDPDFNDLIDKLNGVDYYPELFTFAFGDDEITEDRIQTALGQFIRSIQSFDSKYDVGRALANNDNQDFSNFTVEENLGKQLFMLPPPEGGAGCDGCHRAPEFDINPNSGNNGVISIANNATDIDITNTRSPSLRDLFNAQGELNGSLMHNGEFSTLEAVIDHYDRIVVDPENSGLDNRLRAGGNGQNLRLTDAEKDALVAFVKTLSGSNVYSDDRWSDPFAE